ncbi:uncharacterized protein N7483_000030 [Penicillium malachiteum]|uniref:uncharacterized protein n=1 Tax=Penicillium malachiteum TaxID=1324776 RepID=UPI0025472A51|nr:uncharacterized protein N7483_000030 [Penicillium malachiteum]KAJ5734905.1 hypothetical protein N7483_000030 [Penicillium malachiteum]
MKLLSETNISNSHSYLSEKHAVDESDGEDSIAYTVTEQPIGTRRPLRLVCLGAGYSGLMIGIMFNEQRKDKNAELVIYERNSDLGGTWLENR